MPVRSGSAPASQTARSVVRLPVPRVPLVWALALAAPLRALSSSAISTMMIIPAPATPTAMPAFAPVDRLFVPVAAVAEAETDPDGVPANVEVELALAEAEVDADADAEGKVELSGTASSNVPPSQQSP
ncbi:hypothetical protein IFM51744_00002 [Aspergillus udagawae]|nr:hypothetical protein IFM51744_00002 [Aspergillus udagawae]